MASRTVWILAGALTWAPVASAATLLCETALEQPEQNAQQAKARQPDGKDSDGKDRGGRDARDQRRAPWWKAEDTRAELGISDKQSREIDEVFQSTLPGLRAAKEELDKLDDAVAKLVKDTTADVNVVARQVAQAEQVRGNLNSQRTIMLFRMHRLLTPEQRTKLDAMFARREAERRKNDSNDRR
jgi:Spy/CpxP family protein refolding chaperone